MARKQIEVGMVYSAKVGGTFLPVRIDASLGRGRYEGVRMTDGEAVKVTTGAIRGDGQSAESWQAQRAQQEAASEAEPAADTPDTTAAEAGPAAQGVRGGQAATSGRKISGLDAAAAVLAEAGEPLSAGEMVKRMLAGGLWSTGGKTPAATIYSAIVREISVKGAASRFRKADRGRFELTAAGEAATAGREVA